MKYIIPILLIFFFIPMPLFAQSADDGTQIYNVDLDIAEETPSNDDYYSMPKDFSGTLAEDDPDSDEGKTSILFGPDDAEEEDFEVESEGPTHLLKFDFESQVVVTDTLTDIPFLEISYTLKLEQEIEVIDKRYRTTGNAEIMTDIVGFLAGNELFTCKLDIQLENVEADILVRYKYAEETEEDPEINQLAVQVKFDKDSMLEDWFSNCLGLDGSIFNTQGDKEKYLLTTLETATPDLTGLMIEDYYRGFSSSVDIIAEPLIIEDGDTHEDYLLQGNGMLTVEPF